MSYLDDYRAFIRTLRRHRVHFVVIGGYAVAHHGNPRATEDIDVLIEQSEANIRRIERALREFAGAVPPPRALRRRGGMVRLGGPSAHIDITTKVDGIGAFGPVWERREKGDFYGEPTWYVSLRDLFRTKRAANRPKDLGDIDFLRKLLAKRPR